MTTNKLSFTPLPSYTPLLRVTKNGEEVDAKVASTISFVIPASAWLPGAYKFGDFAGTPAGEAARKLLTFWTSAITNASILGSTVVDSVKARHAVSESNFVESSSCAIRFPSETNGRMTTEFGTRYPRLPKALMCLEVLSSVEEGEEGRRKFAGMRVFIFFLDPYLDAETVASAWIARCGRNESQYEFLFHLANSTITRLGMEGVLDEDEGGHDGHDGDGGDAFRSFKFKYPRKVANRTSAPVQLKEYVEVDEDVYGPRTAAEFYNTVVIPYLEEIVRIDRDSIKNASLQEAVSFMNTWRLHEFLPGLQNDIFWPLSFGYAFGDASFSQELLQSLPDSIDLRAMEKSKYVHIRQVSDTQEEWHQFPFPSQVLVVSSLDLTPAKLFESLLPWRENELDTALEKVVQTLPVKDRKWFSERIDETEELLRETSLGSRVEHLDKHNSTRIVADAFLTLEQINTPLFEVMTKLSSYQWEREFFKTGPIIRPSSLRSMWKLFYDQAFAFAQRAIARRRDLSIAAKFAFAEIKTNPIYRFPFRVLKFDSPGFAGFDSWGKHQILVMSGFERSLNLAGNHHIIRMVAWCAATVYLPRKFLIVNPVFFGEAATGKSYLIKAVSSLIPEGKPGSPFSMIGRTTRETAMIITVPINDCFSIVASHEMMASMVGKSKHLSSSQYESMLMHKTAMTEGRLSVLETVYVDDESGEFSKGNGRIKARLEMTREYRKVVLGATNTLESDNSMLSRFMSITPNRVNRTGRSAVDRLTYFHGNSTGGLFGQTEFHRLERRVWMCMALMSWGSTCRFLPLPNISVAAIVLSKIREYLGKTIYRSAIDMRRSDMIMSSVAAATLWHAAFRFLTWDQSPAFREGASNEEKNRTPLTLETLRSAGPLMFATESLAIDVICSYVLNDMDITFHQMMVHSAKVIANYEINAKSDILHYFATSFSIHAKTVERLLSIEANKDYAPRIFCDMAEGKYDPNYIYLGMSLGEAVSNIMDACAVLEEKHDKDQMRSKIINYRDNRGNRIGSMTVNVLPRVPIEEGDAVNDPAEVIRKVLRRYLELARMGWKKHSGVRQQTLPIFITPFPGMGRKLRPLLVLREFLYSEPLEEIQKAVKSLQYAYTRKRRVMLGHPISVFDPEVGFDVTVPHALKYIDMKPNPKKPVLKVSNPNVQAASSIDVTNISGLYDIGLTGDSFSVWEFGSSYEDALFRRHLIECGLDPNAPENKKYYPTSESTTVHVGDDKREYSEPICPETVISDEKRIVREILVMRKTEEEERAEAEREGEGAE